MWVGDSGAFQFYPYPVLVAVGSSGDVMWFRCGGGGIGCGEMGL